MLIFKLLELPVHNSEIMSRRFGPTDLPGGLCVSQKKQYSEMGRIYKAGRNNACVGHRWALPRGTQLHGQNSF